MAQLVKNLPAMQETCVWSLGWEDPLEKGKLPTPVFWPEEFHGLYSPWGFKELDMFEQLLLSLSNILGTVVKLTLPLKHSWKFIQHWYPKMWLLNSRCLINIVWINKCPNYSTIFGIHYVLDLVLCARNTAMFKIQSLPKEVHSPFCRK